MKQPDYYDNLPDCMTSEQLQHEFAELVAVDPRIDAESVSNALFELSDRQWNTYTLLDDRLRCKIALMIDDLWDGRNAERAEAILGIISRLGLGDALEKLQEKDSREFSCEVRTAVEEAIREFGDSVNDPYSGMGPERPS